VESRGHCIPVPMLGSCNQIPGKICRCRGNHEAASPRLLPPGLGGRRGYCNVTATTGTPRARRGARRASAPAATPSSSRAEGQVPRHLRGCGVASAHSFTLISYLLLTYLFSVVCTCYLSAHKTFPGYVPLS